MNVVAAQVGAAQDEIDTPALVVDRDAFGRNIERMAQFARAARVRLRPHAKTHKCPAIALRHGSVEALWPISARGASS